MAILVKNERTDPFILGQGAGKKTINPGDVALITEDEWGQVAVGLRGPGRMNPVWPNRATSDSSKTMLDYYSFGGDSQIRYIGFADQADATSSPVWYIKRFQHVDVGGLDPIRVSEIQILENVAWDNRDSLPWS